MTTEFILQTIEQELNIPIQHEMSTDGMLNIIVDKEKLLSLIVLLRSNYQLNFNFLEDLTAVHYPDNKGKELCVVYTLQNMEQKYRLRIKAFLDIAEMPMPTISSIVNIFNSANWMERETYDFFGVYFNGHPNLKRILNVDEMTYFPLRKEYPLEDSTRKDKDDEMFGR